MHAARQGEPAQWPLGDALIEECGEPGDDHAHNGAYTQIREAQAELLANGINRELNCAADVPRIQPPVSLCYARNRSEAIADVTVVAPYRVRRVGPVTTKLYEMAM